MPRYLVYLRREVPPRSSPERLARATGISRADADRVLKARTPQSLAVLPNREQASGFLRRLRDSGVAAFAIESKALRRFHPTPIRDASRESDSIVWGGHALRPGEVRMIVVGRIRREKASQIRNDSYSAAAFGVAFLDAPAARIGAFQDSPPTVTRSEESFCCLFRDSEEAYRFRESEFRYRDLLPSLPSTRSKSFRKIVELARAFYPDALYDESLLRAPMAVRREGGAVRIRGGETVEETKEGSTEGRALTLAYLLFLQAFGRAGGS